MGSQHPGEIAGLIYLDSVDSYSFYDPKETDMVMDMVDVRHQIDAFEADEPLSAAVFDQIRDSAAALEKSAGRMADNVAMAGGREDPAPPPVWLAIFFGKEKSSTRRCSPSWPVRMPSPRLRKSMRRPASVVTAKPAIRGHFKTGHRDWPKT
jgi:hypothetical protein